MKKEKGELREILKKSKKKMEHPFTKSRFRAASIRKSEKFQGSSDFGDEMAGEEINEDIQEEKTEEDEVDGEQEASPRNRTELSEGEDNHEEEEKR